MRGIEPPTAALQKRCSAIELHRLAENNIPQDNLFDKRVILRKLFMLSKYSSNHNAEAKRPYASGRVVGVTYVLSWMICLTMSSGYLQRSITEMKHSTAE